MVFRRLMTHRNPESTISEACGVFRSASALLFCAGAGMSVDSGLPDFRGREGFWRAYPAYRELGLRFEELANPVWFERDPHLAWGFYGHRLNLYRSTQPHDGFAAFLRMVKTKPEGYFVFTSNVDEQFQKAGFAEDRMCECHGSIHHLQCTRGCPGSFSAEGIHVEVDDRCRARDPLPACPTCGAMARPNILMFGDWHWDESRTQKQQERLHAWLAQFKSSGSPLAVIECGAGTAVPTVRMFSESIARGFNAPLIRINPNEAEAPPGAISLPAGSREALIQLCS